MRVLVVSAHYPPNFVSGGTLQAQRTARGVRGRGHDVSVYAGWLEEPRRPLDTWTDTDETGLAVRWIVTTPWISWSDERNWDNPAVTDDFAAHLADVRPDVVHFHSLQSLGAGLVERAVRSGARTVVTMHDFWWVCARQFLVDDRMRPCCLVVDAGTCACQVDRPWLERRTAALRRVAEGIDLVLAPSQIAADVLAANGVDPRRLEVDENGLPDLSLRRPPPAPASVAPAAPLATPDGRPPDSVLRLLYVGGSQEMKGVHVLFEAASKLAGRQGWRLLAYDAEKYVLEAGLSVEGLPVELRPPYAPEEIDDVYAEADVVVIPSVMRESFSLATREALVRGVPVLCTDTLGPEEAVAHGRNGLVVAAADPGALARGVERLLDETGLLARLRAGTEAVVVRGMDDQVRGLEGRYRRVLEGPPSARGPATVRRVLFVCGIEGAPLRYRARLPAEALSLVGVESDVVHYRDPALDDLGRRADAVVVYRVPATVQVLSFIEGVRTTGAPVFFDVDDLIFEPAVADEIPALRILPPAEADLWLEGVRRYRTTMEACDVFIGSTDQLCRMAEDAVGMPAERFDNGVGLSLARLSDAALRFPRRPGPLRIAYLSGTNTHDEDWRLVQPAVLEVLRRHPDVELWLVGHVPPGPVDALGPRVLRTPTVPWTELPRLLRDADVNLAPLAPESRFNQAKSAIKWLEAALTETPTVASPTQPFAEVIRSGQNGFLAGAADDWVEALDRLLSDEDLRQRLGRRARRDALLGWSPHLQGRRYLEILKRGADTGARTRTRKDPIWEPVVHSEPPDDVGLEPYVVGPVGHHEGDHRPRASVEPPRSALARLRGLVGRAVALWRTEGPAATLRRAVSFTARQYRSRVRPGMQRASGSRPASRR